ncbi:hypothetical protein [Kitasatospora sp. A2-31]|uniref:hypothetical protein n=1 Tax=Kitasatospora sp. A2-31 TaxID=2916414 RepID=UPI001EEA8E02|nr:hypothetical protein [Kitasatospora sp. A2-31]MCG6494095.1 hypothetical protein [Kitasatospora sp. A2-31]
MSEDPVSPDQVYAALVALRREPVLDPELWPDGPQQDDLRRLLGVLLAVVELEIAASTRPGSDRDPDVAEVLLGWNDQVGVAPGLFANVMAGRLQRTALQLMGIDEGGEDGQTSPGRLASSMAVVAAADTLDADLHLRSGDVERVREALGRAEVSVIEIQQAMHDLRVAIGDAQEE